MITNEQTTHVMKETLINIHQLLDQFGSSGVHLGEKLKIDYETVHIRQDTYPTHTM
jgi:hypothetical protein